VRSKKTTGRKKTVLQEADEIVNGPRQADYGHPKEDFLRTGMIWTAILLRKLVPGAAVEPHEVGLMMAGLKISREVNKHKRDNLVDGSGYLQTVAMCHDDP
jgi:hypothetical protein